MCPRATDMLAVAVQVPAAVVAVENCGVAGRAPTRSGLELEASAGAASASNAQVADATDLMLTTKPPLLASMNQARVGGKTLRVPYKALKPSDRFVRPACNSVIWRLSYSSGQSKTNLVCYRTI
jgi:hypothetical protein